MRHTQKKTIRSASILVWLSGVTKPLIDAKLHPTDRERRILHYASEEQWTPGGLPLRIFASVGSKNGVSVFTNKTQLLEVGPVQGGIVIDLWLPTDESLRVIVDENCQPGLAE